MKIVSQFGTFDRGDDDHDDSKKRNANTKQDTLQVNSLLGTRTIVTTESHAKHQTTTDIPAPSNVQEEEEQLQRALAASLGNNDWPPKKTEVEYSHLQDESYDDHGNMETPLLSSQRHTRPSPPQETFGYFC